MISQFVSIRIVTKSPFGRQVFSAQGTRLSHADKTEVHYLTEGDVTLLALFPEKMVMKREGGQSLEAEFDPTKETQMWLGIGNSESALPLKTERYHVYFTEKDIFVRLSYCLSFGQELQKFQIEISIRNRSEEK